MRSHWINMWQHVLWKEFKVGQMLSNCSLKTKCLKQSGLQTWPSIGNNLIWQRRKINCNDLIKMFVWMVAWANHDEYICWGWHKPLFGKDVRLCITFNIMSKFGKQHRPWGDVSLGTGLSCKGIFVLFTYVFLYCKKFHPMW